MGYPRRRGRSGVAGALRCFALLHRPDTDPLDRSRQLSKERAGIRRDLVIQVPRHHGVGRGTFALRSPARPNPIAMSVARLIGVDGSRLSVSGLDCLDGTPLLDIKPYFASTDSVAEAVVGWHAKRGTNAES